MKTSRLLAAFLTITMVISMMTVEAAAAEDDRVYEAGKVYLDKTATLEDDGTYTIDLEAFATGSPVTTEIISGKPLDIILVLDQSGSMVDYGYDDDLREAVNAFIEQVVRNGATISQTHRIAVVGFASGKFEQYINFSPDSRGEATHRYSLGSAIDNWSNTGIYLTDGTFKNYESFELKEIDVSELDPNNDQITYSGEGSNYDTTKYLPRYYVDLDHDGDGQLDGVKRPLYCETTTSGWGSSQTTQHTWRIDFRAFNDQYVEPIEEFNDVKYYERVNADADGDFIALTDTDYQNTFNNVTDGEKGKGQTTAALLEICNNLGASGATRPGVAMEMARKIYEKNPFTEQDIADDRERVVVVFTDGQPGYSSFETEEANAALAEAKVIKQTYGAEIYTIGLHTESLMQESGEQIRQFLHGLSSNYPDVDSLDDVYGEDATESYNLANLDLTTHRNNYGQYKDTDFYVKIDDNYYRLQIRCDRSGWIMNYSYTYSFRYVIDEDEGEYVDYPYNYSGNSINNHFYQLVTSEGYKPAASDKYYKEESDPTALKGMFPTIVNESTSTILENEFLTTGSILRDIMGEGFVLTDNTVITAYTLQGHWESEEQESSTIKWADEPVKFDTLNVKDEGGILNLDRPNNDLSSADFDRIQIYNTNENNHYNLQNPTAPHTVDISGFNYNDEFIGIGIRNGEVEKHYDGKKLIVKITGVEAVADKITYDQQTVTNHYQSGLWAPIDENGKRDFVASFPVPDTYFTDATYVMDYAKPLEVSMDEIIEKLEIGTISTIDNDGMNYFATATQSLGVDEGGRTANGKVEIANGKFTYTPMTTSWNGYDSVYLFGDLKADSNIKNYEANGKLGNVWSGINVIPANNIYFEDTFVSDTETGTVGIEYTGSWTVEGTNGNNAEHVEHEEGSEFGGVHGWEDALADDAGYSDGSAHVSSDFGMVGQEGASATFEFTGTGVDVYSRTNMQSGAILAYLYKIDKEAGTNQLLGLSLIDNLSASGDYYQIPTLSFMNLDYGTYKVKLVVGAKKENVDDNEEGVVTTRSTYYLDGIRVYDPIKNQENKDVVVKAYGDSEINATFKEVRDILMEAGTFETGVEANENKVLFVDRLVSDEDGNENGQKDFVNDTTTWQLAEYKDYGPKNEVYLRDYQMIAFATGGSKDTRYYVGMKSPTGQPINVEIFKDGIAQEVTINHTTDMYYEVTPTYNEDLDANIIAITNMGFEDDNEDAVPLLSITKLKVAGPTTMEFGEYFSQMDTPTLLSMVKSVYREANKAENTEPEVTEPEATEPDVPRVEIVNPIVRPEHIKDFEGFDDVLTRIQELYKTVNDLFSSIRSWFI